MDVKCKVKKDYGNIGGKKKLTYTSWNDNEPRFDIRDWYDDGNCGKGITLDIDELKSLYDLLKKIDDFEGNDIVVDEIAVVTNDYPDDVQEIFDTLDELFDGFSIVKDYGKMPFADGERIQYTVKKGKKKFPTYETTLENLGLKSFITDKGNLYIYTL